MFTLAWILNQGNRCFVLFAGLINMPWLHSLKTRHEQQKEPDYLKKDPIISGIPVKNYFFFKKKLNIQRSLPEVFLKNTVSSLFFKSTCNFPKKGTSAQLFSYEFCEFSGRLLLNIVIICKEHFKMWEEWELRYCDHLPPSETEL